MNKKIELITINNFRGISTYELRPDFFNVILKQNGYGKTSLAKALRFLFTGIYSKDDIRIGTESMNVTVRFEDGTILGRTAYLPESLAVNGTERSEEQFQKAVSFAEKAQLEVIEADSNKYFHKQETDVLLSFLKTGKTENTRVSGIKKLHIRAISKTNTISLFRREGKSVRTELNGKTVTVSAFEKKLENLGIRKNAVKILTSSELVNAMTAKEYGTQLMDMVTMSFPIDHISERAGFTAKETDVVRTALRAPDAPVGISEIREVHKVITDMRKNIGFMRDEQKKKAIFEYDTPRFTSKELQEKLNELSKAIGKNDALKRMHMQYDSYLKRMQKAANDKAEITKQLQLLGEVVPVTAEEEEIQKSAEELYANAISSLQASDKALRTTHAGLVASVKKLQNAQNCPLCDKITCQTDKTPIIRQLTKDANKIALQLQEISESYKKRKADEESLKKNRSILEERKIRVQNKALLQARLSEVEKAMEEQMDKPEPLSDISDITTEKKRLEELMRQRNLYDAALKAKEQYMGYDVSYKMYTELLKKVDPKNGTAVKMIIHDSIGPLETYCKRTAKDLSGADLTFTMSDEGFEIRLKPEDSEIYVKSEHLSNGERMVLAFIMMDLISHLSGTGILLFDNIETMDENTLKKFLSYLKNNSMGNRYQHILFTGVDHQDITALFQNEMDFFNKS